MLVPHSIAMGDARCPLCHGEPARDHGIFEDCDYCHHVEPRSTLPDNHRDFGVETCLDCHEPEAPGDSTSSRRAETVPNLV